MNPECPIDTSSVQQAVQHTRASITHHPEPAQGGLSPPPTQHHEAPPKATLKTLTSGAFTLKICENAPMGCSSHFDAGHFLTQSVFDVFPPGFRSKAA